MEEVLTDYPHGMYCLIKKWLFNLKFIRKFINIMEKS